MFMANITLAIPDDLYRKMKLMREIRWSEVARRAIAERVDDLEVMDKIALKSKLTRKDVDEINEKIKRGIAKKFNEDVCDR